MTTFRKTGSCFTPQQGPARRLGKLAASTATATLALFGLAALSGPAGAQEMGGTDTTPPTANPTTTPEQNANGWNNQDFVINWNWTDADSGLADDCPLTSATISSEGVYGAGAGCNDNSFNRGEASFDIRLDKTAPQITVDPNTAGDTELRFSATDELSGVDRFECRVDDGPFETCSSPLNLSTLPPGRRTVEVIAHDQASNQTPARRFEFTKLATGSTVIDGVRFTHKRTGDLTIIGTQQDDNIFVNPGAEPGQIRIGFQYGPEHSVWVGSIRNLTITTRGGNDNLYTTDVSLPGNLSVNTGRGRGKTWIAETAIAGRLNIRTDSDQGGDPSLVNFRSSSISGSVTVTGGRYDSELWAFQTNIDGRLSIRAGSGTNTTVLIESKFRSFDYRGGRDTDLVDLVFSDLGVRPRINTDGGDDKINLWYGDFDQLNINSGGGDDQIVLGRGQGTFTGQTVRVSTGAGNDSLKVEPGLAAASSFDGAAGQDSYEGPETHRLRNFETINPVG